MQDALAGRVNFTAGEAYGGGAGLSLEDVLMGAGLMNPDPLEEELPPHMDDLDLSGDNERLICVAQDISDSIFGTSHGASTNPDLSYFPYPNKSMMKTDILFSSPRMRFSRQQKEAILAWGKSLGAKDVPSLHRVDKFQDEALAAVGNPTAKVKTDSGNIFYTNKIAAALSKDYAHPETRRKMHLLPEFVPNGKPITEVWQTKKWLVDVPDDLLTPMVRIHRKDFYVHELVYCSDGTWFLPQRFFELEGNPWSLGLVAQSTENGLVVSDNREFKNCDLFDASWPEIEASNAKRNLFAPQSAHHATKMPNPNRERAQGLEWECPPIVVFIDDVSGNSTKQWNVHYSCYLSNGSLPRAELERDCNIRFVATSPHASPMEIISAVCDEGIYESELGAIRVWDSVKERHILIRPWLLFLPGDNPMQAELCSHIGLKGNFFCRTCHVGGSQEFKQSNEGFPSLTKIGRPRTVEETQQAVLQQLVDATHAAADKALKESISSSGVKDSFAMPVINRLVAIGKALRKSTPQRKALSPEAVNKHLYEELLKRKDLTVINPLLRMEGFDVHQDTPVEALHTHLLGAVKYFWSQTVWILEKQGKLGTFQARLGSLAQSGLNIPNIMADYMCRYRGSLIGKHFKTLSQVMSFAICGLVEQRLLDAWLTLGRLTALIWETEITDMREYTNMLQTTIQDLIDHAAVLSPSLLTLKNKLHILLHLPAAVERFGPALLFSTERYESFNRIFRLCSIHSNRQAPSRDIATAFANQDRCRHMVTGGFWFDKHTSQWVCASPSVREHIQNDQIDRRLLGVDTPEPRTPGALTFPTRTSRQEKRVAASWAATKAGRAGFQEPAPGSWETANAIVTLTGDTAPIGSEVLVRHGSEAQDSALTFASITEILSRTQTDGQARIIGILVRKSRLDLALHPLLKMPLIHRDSEMALLNPEDVICAINVQHDCNLHGCTDTNNQPRRQEREATDQLSRAVTHHDTVDFIVNMHSLHNQKYLRAALPAVLLDVTLSFADRDSLLRQAAESLRDQKLQKQLAKDAAAQKRAEDALSGAGLLDIALEDEDADNVVTQTDLDAAPAHAPVPQSSSMDASMDLDSISLTLDAALAPRGPRQRRPEPPSNARARGRGRGRGNAAQRGRNARGTQGEIIAPIFLVSPTVSIMEHMPLTTSYFTAATGNPADSHGGPWMTTASAPLPGGGLGSHPENITPPPAAVPIIPQSRGTSSGLGSAFLPPTSLSRTWIEQRARQGGLDEEQIKEVLAFGLLTYPEMLIDLKIQNYQIVNDTLKRYLRMIIRHPTFTQRTRQISAAFLLAPSIAAYLAGLLNHVLDWVSENLGILYLTPGSRNDPSEWSSIRTAFSKELASLRNNMKNALELSVRNKKDIYQLTKSLMTYDLKPTSEHWGRFAFLRACVPQFKARVTVDPETKVSFWDHVDLALDDIRKAYKHITPESARQLAINGFFRSILTADQIQYPMKSSPALHVSYIAVQLTEIQRNVSNSASRMEVNLSAAGATVSEPADEENYADNEMELDEDAGPA
ncbi:uncharacterized protein B0H18DRAFT_936500 [Fomitopsis serialis]|uniref:uncharacterized protein n=1 Tax=Fomitopsis serialis TaxID=139415 RepID=UPI002007C084|nr:uncharacterized protein B0H18DRAFT_936500 [Neoantrodia serialis]KAH9920588.1 hypothetical protein B0H18DRAFT_936500 [Neoantrodia serialis]